MKQLNKQPKLEWLASHQDDGLTLDIETLPICTELNIEADKLATIGLQYLHPKPRVLLDIRPIIGGCASSW